VKITPPTPAPPPSDGFTRHQYLLAFARKDYLKLIEEQKLSLTLIEYFGFVGSIMAEKVRDCENWVVYHVWADHADNE
jgi:hypothetical protein